MTNIVCFESGSCADENIYDFRRTERACPYVAQDELLIDRIDPSCRRTTPLLVEYSQAPSFSFVAILSNNGIVVKWQSTLSSYNRHCSATDPLKGHPSNRMRLRQDIGGGSRM